MMFLLVLIGVPVLEVFVFIEVGSAIGWLAAVVLLLATSVLGARLLRSQGRATIERVTRAVSERRSPARGAIDGLLGFLGGGLLLTPGFVTDAMGALLLLPVTRRLAARWISRHYAGRVVRFVAVTGQVVSAGPRTRPADVDSTAVEHEPDQLGS
jgi:UPF0716 protein FxsA